MATMATEPVLIEYGECIFLTIIVINFIIPCVRVMIFGHPYICLHF